MTENRKEDYYALISNLPEEEQHLFDELITHLIKIEKQLEELKDLPQLLYNKNRPEEQKPTPASKLYKEKLGVYQNLLTTFTRILKLQGGAGEEDDLARALKEFATDSED